MMLRIWYFYYTQLQCNSNVAILVHPDTLLCLYIAYATNKTWWCCRSLIAIGTICAANAESKRLAHDLNVQQTAQEIQQRPSLDAKLKSIATELVSMLT